jgi:hypothetical protein
METEPFTDVAPINRELSTRMSTSAVEYTVKFQRKKYYLGKIFENKTNSLLAKFNAAVCSTEQKLNALGS